MEQGLATNTERIDLESSVTVIEKQAQRRIFKIIVIGDSNVGKTCLTYRFCSGKFPDKTEATIGVDFRERTVEIDKEQVKVKTAQNPVHEETNTPMLPGLATGLSPIDRNKYLDPGL